MKKTIAFLMALLMCLSLSACKSPAEKKQEELNRQYEEAKRTAEESARKYNQLLEDYAQYERMQGLLNGAS